LNIGHFQRPVAGSSHAVSLMSIEIILNIRRAQPFLNISMRLA